MNRIQDIETCMSRMVLVKNDTESLFTCKKNRNPPLTEEIDHRDIETEYDAEKYVSVPSV